MRSGSAARRGVAGADGGAELRSRPHVRAGDPAGCWRSRSDGAGTSAAGTRWRVGAKDGTPSRGVGQRRDAASRGGQRSAARSAPSSGPGTRPGAFRAARARGAPARLRAGRGVGLRHAGGRSGEEGRQGREAGAGAAAGADARDPAPGAVEAGGPAVCEEVQGLARAQPPGGGGAVCGELDGGLAALRSDLLRWVSEAPNLCPPGGV